MFERTLICPASATNISQFQLLPRTTACPIFNITINVLWFMKNGSFWNDQKCQIWLTALLGSVVTFESYSKSNMAADWLRHLFCFYSNTILYKVNHTCQKCSPGGSEERSVFLFEWHPWFLMGETCLTSFPVKLHAPCKSSDFPAMFFHGIL